MVTYNRTNIEQKLLQAFSEKKQAEVLAFNSLKSSFDKEKRVLIGNFQNHPVTQEIEDGPGASNKSGTLGRSGNLFSFIGFNAGDNPTEVVRDMLFDDVNLIKILRKKTINQTQKRVKFTFSFKTPSLQDIYKKTPYPGDGSPWSPGSWVEGISNGISGLQYYFYSLKMLFLNSRSGTAVQRQKTIRSKEYSPVGYVEELLKNFIEKFKFR